MNIDNLLAWLRDPNAGADPAQRMSFITRNPDFIEIMRDIISKIEENREPEPFPALDAITAYQVSVFDNWKPFGFKRPSKGSKGRNIQRFKAEINVWTVPVEKIRFDRRNWQHKFIVSLFEPSKLAVQGAKLGNPKLIRPLPEFGESIVKFANSEHIEGHIAGMLSSKGHGIGTIIHEGQMLMIGDDAKAGIGGTLVDMSRSTLIDLNPFSDRDSRGNAFAGNVVLQSRWSEAPALANWKTR